MEGAGASNVSHAAETRGMDSADEEPELPSAVQDLIRRLEGEGEPITSLIELRREEFRDFFPKLESVSTITGWRSQVRLRVLEAIGSCNTLEHLDVGDMCGGDISRLTESEWEVVFRGFKSSTVLKWIYLRQLEWSSDAEVESLCSQIGRVLNTSSVVAFDIQSKLSARCWLSLASGLRGNPDSKLQCISLWDNCVDETPGERKFLHASAVKHVADMINSAPQLKSIAIDCKHDMEEEAVGILSQALIQSSSLVLLSLMKMKWGKALLLNALAGHDRNRSIEHLWLEGMDGLGGCLRKLLTSNPSLKKVTLDNLRMSPEEWRQLGEFILARAANIDVSFLPDLRDEWESIEALTSAANSDVKDPTMELELYTLDEDELMLSLNLLGRVLRGEIKSLKSFRISARNPGTSGTSQDRWESFLSMNGKTGETSVLKKLRLYVLNEDVGKGVWKDVLLCLRGNTSVTHLDLSPNIYKSDPFIYLHEESFKDLMALLQVNLTLQEINVSYTSWATDGKEWLIQEALKQNQKRAAYMSVFIDAKLKFGEAKAGRLFLCGSPLAGKTQLRLTMVHGQNWFRRKRAKSNWRTEGIEVEFLQNNDEGQISVWDLAGQESYRTLQSVLFPQSSNFCIFLFVYSPFCHNTSSCKDESCFEKELEEWLSFITSCTRVTGHNLPQVLVVISHKDKAGCKSLKWAHSIMAELTQRFARFVDLHPVQEFFHVDARETKQVILLKNHIFEIFHKLLSEKSPRVPQVCSQLSHLLVKKTKKNRRCPLWPSKKFHDFCAPVLIQFCSSSLAHARDHSKIMKSIISYLNDSGSIVSISNLDYIIVDPNWLTNKLLGKLVALMSRDSSASKDGFVSESVFAGLIEEFLAKESYEKSGVDRDVLESILINLDLCFKVEGTSQYFIPSFIPEHASTEVLKPQELADVKSKDWALRVRVGTSKFVGIRIQCQDRRTMSLTAAFFPCFQMFMRRKLISEMHVDKETVTCSRHYMRLFLDGHEIYLEQGTSRNYVDVLMLCSDLKPKEVAIDYVMKHIVQELISFCASPKGCPGVALVLGLIQTRCVEMLIPSHLRGTILIEQLKSNFICYINDKLENIKSDRFHLVKQEELFSYEHSWHSIEGHTEVVSERARDLLWESDVEAVVNEIPHKKMQQLESLRQGLIEVNNHLVHSHLENENRITNSSLLDMKDSNRPSTRCLRRASTSVENRATQILLERMDQVEKTLGQQINGVDERLRSVQSHLQRLEIKMEQILSLQQELQTTVSDFMSKLDRLIEYSQEFQQTRIPKRPYITDDVGLFYRMSAKLHAGITVRLHLMCESTSGFHPVKDQEGLKIRVDQDNRSWISKTIEISLKVMYYASKAGLDVTLGLGQAIPDWVDLKSDIVKLDSISDDDRRAVLKGGESMDLEEAWLRIQQTLEPINYSAVFKLYQVKYMRLELGGHAWVCKECMEKGRRSGILTN